MALLQKNRVVAVTSITLKAAATSIEIGKTTQITATVLPADATDKTVAYSINDKTLGTIDAKGVLTGIKAGMVTVTGTDSTGKVNGTVDVTITDPAK